MKDFIKWILIEGLPLWIVLGGATFLIIGGINDQPGRTVFQAIGQSDGPLIFIGAALTVIGLGLFLFKLIRGIFNK